MMTAKGDYGISIVLCTLRDGMRIQNSVLDLAQRIVLELASRRCE